MAIICNGGTSSGYRTNPTGTKAQAALRSAASNWPKNGYRSRATLRAHAPRYASTRRTVTGHVSANRSMEKVPSTSQMDSPTTTGSTAACRSLDQTGFTRASILGGRAIENRTGSEEAPSPNSATLVRVCSGVDGLEINEARLTENGAEASIKNADGPDAMRGLSAGMAGERKREFSAWAQRNVLRAWISVHALPFCAPPPMSIIFSRRVGSSMSPKALRVSTMREACWAIISVS